MPKLTFEAAKEQIEETAMQIEIAGETERLIQAALATGKFATVDEFIATMARGVQPKGTSTELPEIPKHVD